MICCAFDTDDSWYPSCIARDDMLHVLCDSCCMIALVLRFDLVCFALVAALVVCWPLQVFQLPAGCCKRKSYLLNLSAKAKRCRINLFKRHRFAIANFKSSRLIVLKLLADSIFVIQLLRFSSQLLIANC
ncbi:F-box protein [Dorcoceras hygrometricum]|uniref:F-box protein n=1 Tax=Dorcoceras hygrometricum TaxID=472368 RepID=A0A2Z7CD99_9LAMI|nr:F-box protein [Dorcoceras hygrometricum]